MNLNKFLGAFKASPQIMEGIKNKIFKKEHVLRIVKTRRISLMLSNPF